MQVILGSNGVIGREITKALQEYNEPIRLVSRNPKKIHENNELFPADLKDAEQVQKAIQGCDVAYLTVGLEYKTRIWQKEWPLIMKNVIQACKAHGCKLLFFDNVYAYGKVDGWMTEESPIKPDSKKGQVRAEIAKMILDEVKAGDLKAIITRAPDFYGPETPLSFFNLMVIENMLKGKSPQWMINQDLKHSLIYTPDAGKACAILGNTESAFDQIWHLPTDRKALTGKEYVQLAGKIMGKEANTMVLKRWFLGVLGLFINAIKENMEMLYQVDSPYLFDSSKFEKAFGFGPTDYEEGLRSTIESMKG